MAKPKATVVQRLLSVLGIKDAINKKATEWLRVYR